MKKEDYFASLNYLFAADDLKENNDNCNHQKYVNEPSHGVGSDQTQQPEDQQDYRYSEQHGEHPFP